MTLRYADNCVEHCDASAGTTTLQLQGVASGDAQTFVSGIGDGNDTDYRIVDGSGWIIIRGTVNAGSPNTLVRTKIWASSNAGADVTFTGTSIVQSCNYASGQMNFLNVMTGVQRQKRTTSISNPTALTFSKRGAFRPIELLCPALTDLQDDLLADFGLYPNRRTNSGVTRTWTGTGLSIATPSGGGGADQWSDIVLKAPFYTTIVEVSTKGSGTGYNSLYAGLWQDANNKIAALVDSVANQAKFVVTVAGTDTYYGSVALTIGNPPFKLALICNANGLQLWVNSAASGFYSGWRFLTSMELTSFDLRDPAVLSTFHPGFAAAAGSATSIVIQSFACGYYGQIGLRDPRPVIRKDGTPYIVDGEYYFTMSPASVQPIPGGVMTAAYGHQGIYAFCPKRRSLRKTGMLFSLRGSPTLIYNDYAGQIVFDDDLDEWRVLLVTWGSRTTSVPISIQQQTYSGDILNGVTVLENMANLALSHYTGSNVVYDPDLKWDQSAALWRIAYTYISAVGLPGNTNAYPILDHSNDLVTFANDFADSASVGYEGTQQVILGGNRYVIAGSNANQKAWSITGTVLGTLNITLPTTTQNPPWPAVFPVMDGAVTYWWMLTFDGSQFGASAGSLASLVLYEAAETENGFEFDLHGVT